MEDGSRNSHTCAGVGRQSRRPGSSAIAITSGSAREAGVAGNESSRGQRVGGGPSHVQVIHTRTVKPFTRKNSF